MKNDDLIAPFAVKGRMPDHLWPYYDRTTRQPVYMRSRHDCADGSKDLYFWRTDGPSPVMCSEAQGNKAAPHLYRVDEVVADDYSSVVYVVEGEKCADALRSLGLIATTAWGGAAGRWEPEYTAALRHRAVAIIPDTDRGGVRYAHRVRREIEAEAAAVVVTMPLPVSFMQQLAEQGVPIDEVLERFHGYDVHDFIAEGYDFEPFQKRILAALVPKLEAAVGEARKPPKLRGASIVRMSDVTAEAVQWIWPGRLARGKLSLIDGDPGLGKSTVTLDIAARITTGRPFPDGAAGIEPGSVVLLASEDGLADTVQPRLAAAGADLSKVVNVNAVIDKAGAEQFPSLSNVAEIEEVIRHIGDVRLLVVDPVAAFWGQEINAYKDQDVRRCLGPLKDLAERTRIAILLVRHLTKTKGLSAMHKGGGSVGILGACRLAFIFAREDPSNPVGRVIIATSKSNLARPAPSLAFGIEDDGRGVAVVGWVQGTVQTTAAELVSAMDDVSSDEGHGPREEAKAFIRNFLASGPKTAREMEQASKALGVKKRTLERARIDLGCEPFKGSFASGWLWRLPAEDDPRKLPEEGSDPLF